MNSKLRLDELLVKKFFFQSRSKASEAIKSGKVKVDGQLVDKPGKRISEDAVIEIIDHKFVVGRAYYKLEKALDSFEVSIKGKRVCDLGASTGGFTQLLLERGAKVVYAVDVGTSQLHPFLKSKSEVVSLENTDARHVTPEILNGAVDIVTADLSFISITKVATSITGMLKTEGDCICLIKPQFEAGPGVTKKGVVLSPMEHREILNNVNDCFFREGLWVKDVIFSPLRGRSGNIEYLIHAKKKIEDQGKRMSPDIDGCVEEAFKTLIPER